MTDYSFIILQVFSIWISFMCDYKIYGTTESSFLCDALNFLAYYSFTVMF
jgi:hypothetical protein